MNKCIVYTRQDGGVSIHHPTDDIISWMGCGGYWNDRPPGFSDEQISRQVADGIDERSAVQFVRALQRGGCTTAEALEIIRDRDCARFGTGIELWDASDLESDRWFRNAWRRSHNGGPISIDVDIARGVQFQRIRSAVETENKRRLSVLSLFDQPIELDWHKVRRTITKASEPEEIKAVWPKALGR